MHRIKLILFSLLFALPSLADELSIKLSGEELKKISALEIELEFEPRKAFVLDETVSIHNSFDLEVDQNGDETCPNTIVKGQEAVLFETVDQNNSLIRVFLARPLVKEELLIQASVSRINYSGKIKAKISSLSLIPDFAQEVDASKIKRSLEIHPAEQGLPFMGISRAELLGPRQRVFSENMFVSISNIETYGFTLSKSIRKLRINGQEAKFLNNEIIAVNLELDPETCADAIDIVLELDVDGKTVTKTVDRISFVSN